MAGTSPSHSHQTPSPQAAALAARRQSEHVRGGWQHQNEVVLRRELHVVPDEAGVNVVAAQNLVGEQADGARR